MHFCILGCGGIAKVHARILQKLENFLPGKPIRISFASRDPVKAQAYRKKFSGDLALGSYEEAIAHKDIDAVVICTPNDSHHVLTLAALAHRKHVIIEKPIAMTTAESDDIIAQAKKAQRKVFVAENHRYRPSILFLEKVIQSGKLGTPKFVQMNVMRNHKFKPEEWRSSPQQMGGGPLIDGGIHWVNALLTLGGGEATEIQALEPPRTLAHCPGEDSIAIQCRLANGAIGQLTYSWGVQGSLPLKFIGVYGTLGTLYVSNSGMFGLKNIDGKLRPLLLPWRDWKGYVGMWQDFLITLSQKNGRPSLASAEIGRRDLAFVEAVYASAATQSAKPFAAAHQAKA